VPPRGNPRVDGHCERKTEITFTQIGWSLGQMRSLAELGLRQCLDKMAAIFA
jgi:hypothetical protein